MKFKNENKELVSLNETLIFAGLSWYERNKIISYILRLHDEINNLKKQLEDLKNENCSIYQSTNEQSK